MACSFDVTTHVIAIFRHSLADGRTAFRVYDNDSAARLRGTYEVWMARQLWVNCSMTAITVRGSSLHRVAGDISVAGAIRAARQARRAAMGAPSQQTMVRL